MGLRPIPRMPVNLLRFARSRGLGQRPSSQSSTFSTLLHGQSHLCTAKATLHFSDALIRANGRDGVPPPSGLPEASNEIESSGGFVNAPVGVSKRLRNSLRIPLAWAEFHNSYVLPNEEEPHQAYGPRKRLPLK